MDVRSTIKNTECRRIDVFELWFWRRLLRVPWTARSNQWILKEISSDYSLEGLMLRVKFQYFVMWTADSLEKPWCWNDWRWNEKGPAEDEMVWWYHRMNGRKFEQAAGIWWWTGKHGMLQSMESQRVGHDLATELNRTLKSENRL